MSFTVAPPTRAPSGSVTEPVIVPVACCARAGTARERMKRSANREGRGRTNVQKERVIPAASASEADDRRRRRRMGAWKERPAAGGSSAHSLSAQKVDRKNPWVGLLARKERITRGNSPAASPSPADRPSGSSKRRTFTHSGGAAPGFHPAFPLCPRCDPSAEPIYS